MLSGTYGLPTGEIGLGRLSRLRVVSGGKRQLRSMNLSSDAWSAYVCTTAPPREYLDTAMKGMRGPSPKKSIGWKKPESQ